MAKDYVVNLKNPEDSPQKIADKLNTLNYAIDAKVIRGAVPREDFEKFKDTTTKYINGNKERLQMNDQRWHGAGLSQVIHDSTLSGLGNVTSPLTVNFGSVGSVTSVSVITANGISGTVASATTTPAITLNISALDATKIANGSVTNTEFQYLDGVTSAIQTQIDGKVNKVSSTDNAIVRFDGTGGTLQDSSITISDISGGIVPVSTGTGGINITNSTNSYFGIDSVADGGNMYMETTQSGADITLLAGAADTEIYMEAAAQNCFFDMDSSSMSFGQKTGSTYSFLGSSNNYGLLDFSSVSSSNKTFTFPNNTGNVVIDSATQTLTNKRITKRVSSTTSSGSLIPNADTDDQFIVTALATGATIGAPTGTPTQGQSLLMRFKDNGTARALTWNATYKPIGVTLPTTTVISKLLYVGMVYNATAPQWDVISVNQEV